MLRANGWVPGAACWVLSATALLAAAPTATIQKPKAVTVTGGACRVKDDGTLGVNVGPNAAMPTLALNDGKASGTFDCGAVAR